MKKLFDWIVIIIGILIVSFVIDFIYNGKIKIVHKL
jgi:hypothetical protein